MQTNKTTIEITLQTLLTATEDQKLLEQQRQKCLSHLSKHPPSPGYNSAFEADENRSIDMQFLGFAIHAEPRLVRSRTAKARCQVPQSDI